MSIFHGLFTPMLREYLNLGNENIEVRYVAGERQFATETLAVLDKALPNLTAYFQIAEPFPKVRGILAPNRDEFDRLVRDLLQVEIEVPSHPARIAQPQRTDLVALSPSAYESQSTFAYVPDQFGRLMIHELIHMIEEYLSPNIEASPRWWGEGLAVYFSGQWLHDDEFRQAAQTGIAEGNIPNFQQIKTEGKLAYDWGWTIVGFLEHTYGRNLILQIVKGCTDGDIFSMIDIETSILESKWQKWLRDEGHPNL